MELLFRNRPIHERSTAQDVPCRSFSFGHRTRPVGEVGCHAGIDVDRLPFSLAAHGLRTAAPQPRGAGAGEHRPTPAGAPGPVDEVP